MVTSDAQPEVKLCLDCVREKAKTPHARNRNSSYCNSHLHKRSMLSKDRGIVRGIADQLRSAIREAPRVFRGLIPGAGVPIDALVRTNRQSQYKLPLELLEEFATYQEEEAERYRSIILERRPGRAEHNIYTKQIVECLWTAWVLRHRRQPDTETYTRLLREADPDADSARAPTSDLEEEERRRKLEETMRLLEEQAAYEQQGETKEPVAFDGEEYGTDPVTPEQALGRDPNTSFGPA